MNTNVVKKNGYLLEVTVTSAKSEYDKARKAALDEIRKSAKIKGFRAGSDIPEAIIVKEYGEAAIAQKTVDTFIDQNYTKILSKSSIVPVAPGNITAVKSINPIELTLEIETLPEVTIDEKKLKTIKVKKTDSSVTDTDVELAVKEIEKRFTHFHPAGEKTADGFESEEHAAIATGDRVTLDTQGFDKQGGADIPETKVKAFPLVIGSGQFIPGFEEKLVGHKVGDVVEFEITFPKDYHSPAFQGRKVFFVTTVFSLEKPHAPAWTEDFIEKLRGVKTDMAGFREILKKEILEEREYQARSKDEEGLLAQLREISTLEIGPGLLGAEIDRVYSEHAENIQGQGFSIKDYLGHLKQSEEEYKEQVLSEEARKRVSAELILKTLRDLKKIEPNEEEVSSEVEKIIARYTSEKVREQLRTKLVPGDGYYEDIKNRLAYRKVVDSFFA